MESEIINRVEAAGLTEIRLEELRLEGERAVLDIQPFLFQGQLLREKEFRETVKGHDWSVYRNKYVAITCSADAIVPTWAYMLIALAIHPFARSFVFGDAGQLETALFLEALGRTDISRYQNAKVVIKGCGKVPVPESAYVEITRLLAPVAQSIMYGEACSTVPLFKRK
ncbi:MAG: DUF2480 family protein [Bacteroidia bacterium]|nr:DUF2480 family protein [Bacteroidia bacterium]